MILKAFLFIGFLLLLNIGIYAQNAKNKTEPLKIGDVAPDFTLTDSDGKTVTLSKAEMPVVLVFYRGFW